MQIASNNTSVRKYHLTYVTGRKHSNVVQPVLPQTVLFHSYNDHVWNIGHVGYFEVCLQRGCILISKTTPPACLVNGWLQQRERQFPSAWLMPAQYRPNFASAYFH